MRRVMPFNYPVAGRSRGVKSYLRKRRCVDDYFEPLGHLLQKVLGARSFHNVDV